MISKGYTEVNNKFLKSLYITNLDVNNLYYHSMMQLLPNEILDYVNPDIYTDDVQ